MDMLNLGKTQHRWWLILIRGILFLFLGIYMICSPSTSFVVLGFMFGLVILLTGIAELLRVSSDRDSDSRGWHLAWGIIDIIVGIILMGHIATSVAILRVIVGIWFLLRGWALISFGRRLGRNWVIFIGGILTAIFGLLIIFNAVFGSLTIILFMAFAFVIMGFFHLWLGYTMKPR